MKRDYKTFLTMAIFVSLAIVACGNKPSNSNAQSTNSGVSQNESTQLSNVSLDSSIEPLSSEEISSSVSNESSHISSSISEISGCENDLHGYVSYSKVNGGHRKMCADCGAYVGELESHVFFDSNHLYCDACGSCDDGLAQASLSDDFIVKINSSNGVVQRTIITNMYQTANGGLFTISSPSNAHSSYSDFDVYGAKFYYDNNVDDGTKLFMLKETASRKSVGTCKTIYTYSLSVYNGIVPGTFAYTNGHITINEQSISDWLSTNTPLNQITYEYLYVSHHAEAHRNTISGSTAIINEVTCRDCGQFLYQEVEF